MCDNSDLVSRNPSPPPNLSCANLSCANLSCANLSCANLSCANLSPICHRFGIVGGIVINVISSTMGAYLGMLLTRSCFRPYFMRMLGRHASKWRSDAPRGFFSSPGHRPMRICHKALNPPAPPPLLPLYMRHVSSAYPAVALIHAPRVIVL